MRTHDFAAIGVGPFNLGLAALTADLPGLDGVFLDQRAGFDWHPGLMLDGVTIQVPFLADLVTMADPTSRFSPRRHPCRWWALSLCTSRRSTGTARTIWRMRPWSV